MVQRDYGRIIRRFGTPASVPKPRGKSPGRSPGKQCRKRPLFPVIWKSNKINSLKKAGVKKLSGGASKVLKSQRLRYTRLRRIDMTKSSSKMTC